MTLSLKLLFLSPGNFHCKLTWNGELGRLSEVKLEDRSTNGTWINNTYVRKSQQTILRGGAAICLGGAPDVAHNDYRKRESSSVHSSHSSKSHALCACVLFLAIDAFTRVFMSRVHTLILIVICFKGSYFVTSRANQHDMPIRYGRNTIWAMSASSLSCYYHSDKYG